MKEKLPNLFIAFFSYAFLGWCYEVFLEVFIYHWGFSNRGFLFGPYCPVYGCGALLLLICLTGIQKKRKWYSPILIFLGTMLITTAVELLTSYVLEFTTGGWLWDYRSYPFQFDGRIALNPSARFGLGGVLFLYVIQPMLDCLTAKLGETSCRRLALVLFCMVFIDFMLTMVYRVL